MHARTLVTPYGLIPAHVHLHDDPEADFDDLVSAGRVSFVTRSSGDGCVAASPTECAVAARPTE